MSQDPIAIPAPDSRVGARLYRALEKLLTAAADEWHVPQGWIVGLWAIPPALLLTGILAALAGKDVYKMLTEEDHIAEDSQVVFYSLGLLLCLAMVRFLWRALNRRVAWAYLALAVGLFFLIGEEISWGQRIFGWGTPQALSEMNKQGETNIHNIIGVGTTFKWVQLVAGAYGTFAPLLLLSGAFGRYRRTLSLVVPSYTLIPYFVFLFLWRIYRNLVEAPGQYYYGITEYNEVLELILALGIFLFMIFQVRRMERGFDAAPPDLRDAL